MRNLQQLLKECMEEVKSLKIHIGDIKSIEWATLTDAWGKCRREWENDHFAYYLKVSREFQTECINIKELKATICHEILHTCNGCYRHGKRWVNYALKMDAKYHYGIALFKSRYDIVNSESPVIHKIVCPNCGGGWEIKDISDWNHVQNITTGGKHLLCVWCNHQMKIEF